MVWKLKPPLTNLSSFVVDAIVLSYLLFLDDAVRFLRQLSRNALHYANNHRHLLLPFL